MDVILTKRLSCEEEMEVILTKPLHSEERGYTLPKGQRVAVVEWVLKGVIVELLGIQVLLPESYYACYNASAKATPSTDV